MIRAAPPASMCTLAEASEAVGILILCKSVRNVSRSPSTATIDRQRCAGTCATKCGCTRRWTRTSGCTAAWAESVCASLCAPVGALVVTSTGSVRAGGARRGGYMRVEAGASVGGAPQLGTAGSASGSWSSPGQPSSRGRSMRGRSRPAAYCGVLTRSRSRCARTAARLRSCRAASSLAASTTRWRSMLARSAACSRVSPAARCQLALAQPGPLGISPSPAPPAPSASRGAPLGIAGALCDWASAAAGRRQVALATWARASAVVGLSLAIGHGARSPTGGSLNCALIRPSLSSRAKLPSSRARAGSPLSLTALASAACTGVIGPLAWARPRLPLLSRDRSVCPLRLGIVRLLLRFRRRGLSCMASSSCSVLSSTISRASSTSKP